MKNLTVSIFGNKVFLEILKELNLFKNTEIKFIENVEDEILNKASNKNIIIFFLNEKNMDHYFKLKNKDLAILLVNNDLKFIKKSRIFLKIKLLFLLKL